jgi:hypothetical protein
MGAPTALQAGIRTVVVGPAYVDEVVEVHGGLGGPEGPRLDHSLTEANRSRLTEPGVFLLVESPGGDRIRIESPGASEGIRLRKVEPRIAVREYAGRIDSHALLMGTRRLAGGMGAGYALALGGRLIVPVGEGSDPGTRLLLGLLDGARVEHAAVNVPGAQAESTTLLQSSAGDKLPIGRRSASRIVSARDLLVHVPADAAITVIASLPSRTARQVARTAPGWKLFTPSMRNVREGWCRRSR